MGVAFDSYRIVFGQLRFPRWSIHALDLLYWLAASLFVFRALYHSNHGELRFYVFLGLFIGIWIYFLFLSVITERFVVILMKIIRQVYYFVVRLFQLLIIAPIRWLMRLIVVTLGFVWVVILFLFRITLLPLWKVIAWATRPIWTRLGRARWFRSLGKVKDIAVRRWNRWFGKQQDE